MFIFFMPLNICQYLWSVDSFMFIKNVEIKMAFVYITDLQNELFVVVVVINIKVKFISFCVFFIQ